MFKYALITVFVGIALVITGVSIPIYWLMGIGGLVFSIGALLMLISDYRGM